MMQEQAPLIVHGMGSPNVRKVVIMLEELGLPYQLKHVAVFKGEQFTPEFRALNPVGKVPVLIDPHLGAPLAESGAILFWLAERSASALLPVAAPARQVVMQWVMTQMASIGPMLGQLNHFNLLGEAEPYAHGRYTEQAAQLYRLLDDQLADRAWIAGDAYSIADIAIYPWARYLEQHGFDPHQHPALVRWRSTLDERPAVLRAAGRMSEAFDAISTATRRTASKPDLDRFFGRTDAMPDTDFSGVTR